MNDYVSRRWLLTEYDKRHKGPPGGARKMIEEAPAADVRSVKEGCWIADKFQYLNCSECGCDTNLYDQHGFPIGQRKGDPYPRFCPHCGAKMGGTP